MAHERDAPTFTIGKVSRLTGLSSRMLRHYDRLGLVTPTTRGNGGRRLYNEQEVEKLAQLALLRRLDLPLEEVRVLLEQEHAWPDVLSAQLTLVREWLAHLRHLEILLVNAQATLELEGGVSWRVLTPLLTTTPGDVARQHARRQELPVADREALALMPCIYGDSPLDQHWQRVIVEARTLLEQKVSPKSEAGQKLAGEVAELWEETFGNDPATDEAVTRLLRERPEGVGLYSIERRIYEFIEEAVDSFLFGSE